jgi:GDP-4-dehydro-6-deoxy-D-mannose reductase
MKIMITGAGGFLGRYLVELFEGLGKHEVIEIDTNYMAVNGNWFINIQDPKDLWNFVYAMRPDLVIHLAFPSKPVSVLNNYINHVKLVDVPLFKAVKFTGAKMILAGSSSVYGNFDGTITEKSPINPASDYGIGKSLQEMVARKILGESLCVARLFNLVGPGQNPGMLFPDLVIKVKEAIENGSMRVEIGNPESERDFVDVRDAARAILALSNNFTSGIFNIASSESTSIIKLVGMLRKIIGVPLILIHGKNCDSVNRQHGSHLKINRSHEWGPAISLEKSLEDVWNSL